MKKLGIRGNSNVDWTRRIILFYLKTGRRHHIGNSKDFSAHPEVIKKILRVQRQEKLLKIL